LGTIAVLGFTFYKSQTVEFDRYARTQTQLETLRSLEQRVDRDILKVRVGLGAENAALFALTDRMTHQLSALQRGQEGIDQAGPFGINGFLADYASVLVRRKALLQQFNSRNTTVLGALRSFPTLAGVLIDRVSKENPELLRVVSAYERSVWRYYIDASAANATNIELSHRRLKRLAARSSRRVVSYLRPLLHHAEILIAHRSEADYILKDLLAISRVKRLTGLVKSYQEHVSAMRQLSDRYRVLTFSAALLLVGHIALTMLSLVRVRRDLQKVNDALETRIEEVTKAKEDADFANRSKSEFLAMMSHELRTPLNAVIGFSEIIHTEAFGSVGVSKYRDYAGDINKSANHLLSLINDILDLSKIESGNLSVQQAPVEVPLAVEAVEMLIKDRAIRGGVGLKFDCPRAIPWLMADELKLKQMLANLLSNAIKFTERGGEAYLKVRCDYGKGYVFEVGDTGIGMKPEDIPNALAPFVQVDSSLSRKHEGTGLGLPLTKSMIELQGGKLELESEPGAGTVARLVFPPGRIIRNGGAEILPLDSRMPMSKVASTAG
jgi:signal transduction histidine kinase